jgi:hypothetical protein
MITTDGASVRDFLRWSKLLDGAALARLEMRSPEFFRTLRRLGVLSRQVAEHGDPRPLVRPHLPRKAGRLSQREISAAVLDCLLALDRAGRLLPRSAIRRLAASQTNTTPASRVGDSSECIPDTQSRSGVSYSPSVN